MCGILGWFSKTARPPDKQAFMNALLTMRFRGPDDMGVFENEHVRLGHVRLSIIDLAGGHQPWVDKKTGVTITYNGELYNYIEEREILEQKGHRFLTHGDTEVILRMYLEYGSQFLSRTNGMFSFALYDPREKKMFCARDHVGIKPFYYFIRDGAFHFASEIKGLVALCGDFKPEPKAIADYIHLQLVMGEKTFFKDVYRLLPGEYMIVSEDGSVNRKRWYHGAEPQPHFEGTFNEATNHFRYLAEKSVSIQLRSDVPVGAHLSGGLDTASICSLVSKNIKPQKLSTFTAGFTDGGIFDDTEAAAISAHHIGSKHSKIFPSSRDFADTYPKLSWHMDEPMAAEGIFPQYFVSKLAKERVKVVLGGQGADEILGGYTRHYLLLLTQAISNGSLRGKENIGIEWGDLGKSLGQLHNYGPLLQKIYRGGAFDDPVDVFWRMINRSGSMKSHLSPEFVESLGGYSPYETYRDYFNRFPDAELLNKVLYFETSCFLPALLHIEDRMSMAVSLESRVPFLDPELIRFAFSLPTRIKMKNGQTKAVLRAAFADSLAPDIRDRRDKLGFPVPTNRWFTGSLKGFVNDILLSKENMNGAVFQPEALKSAVESPRGDFDRDLWGMLNIALWFRNSSKPQTSC